jgi:hypothetical protein
MTTLIRNNMATKRALAGLGDAASAWIIPKQIRSFACRYPSNKLRGAVMNAKLALGHMKE